MKQLIVVLIALCSCAYTTHGQSNSAQPTAATSTDREQDGLHGPIRRVRVELANVVTREGKQVELKRTLIQISTYDVVGHKTDSVAYPVEGASAPGKEEYKYDDKGNIIEMTLRGDNGSILSKEKYSYEFDEFGNWKKMTASVAVYENGQVTYEPTEVTYRTLTYYYGPTMPKAGTPVASVAARSVDAPAPDTTRLANKSTSDQPAVGSPSTGANVVNKPTPVTNAPDANASRTEAANKPSSVTNAPDTSAKKPTPTSDVAEKSSTNVLNKPEQPDNQTNKPAPETNNSIESQSVSNAASTTALASKPTPTNNASEQPTPATSITPNTTDVAKPAPPSSGDIETNASKDDVQVLRVSEEILRKAAIELPQPQYPAEASLARAAGDVQLELLIDQNGAVKTARPISGNPMLFGAATSAANKARFLMSAFSSQPTKVYSHLTYTFQRPEEATSVSPTESPRSVVSPSATNTSAPASSFAESSNAVVTPTSAKLEPVKTNANSQSFATYFNKGISSLASAKYEDAVHSFTQAIALKPDDAVAYMKLGLANSALGSHKGTIAAYKQAIKLNRAFVDADSYFRLGSAYLALSDYQSAIEPLRQALYAVRATLIEGKSNSVTGLSEAGINDALGRAYYGSGAYRQAAKAFETAVRLKPDFASAHYGLGLSYIEIGDKNSAEKEERTLRKLKSPLADRLAGILLVPATQRNKVF
ncbi:MAG: hypothetical protein C5B55_06490 [Blastocatellia bacterium]|nr:MAG: hypothetical protein C5B55_06490 [Blastocatellia bacterium]